MGAIAGTIPNLIGGVSQQPPDIRPINTAKLLNNVWLSPAIGMVTRPCAEYIGKFSNAVVGADDYIAQHNIQKSSGNYQITVVNGILKVMNTDTGLELPVTVEGTSLSYLNSSNNSRDLGFVTIADTTFIYNRNRTVEATQYPESGISGLTDDGNVRKSPNRHATVWVKQRLSGHNHYSIYVNNEQHASYYTDEQSPSVIADQLIQGLLGTGSNGFLATNNNQGGSVISASRAGDTHSIISILLHNETDWVEAVSSGGGDEAMQAINSTVEEFADLTRSDIDGRMVRVDQSDDEEADDYWVWFNNGAWEETYGWGSKEELDIHTMPVTLVDNLDGTFTLKNTEWRGRTVGDVDSNPTPSFVGKTINNMFIYKGRMCVMSGENFIASQVNNFENFYRSTCTQLLDDDTFDIASPESRGADLEHASYFDNRLLLFSKFDQFTLQGNSDGLLSPNTVDIDRVNSYNNAEDVTPVEVGSNVIFVDDLGNRNYAQLLEYQVERVFGKQVALSLTDSVPEYVPAGVYKICNSTSDNIVLVATEGDRRSLFAYNYYYNNDGKVQAAWNKWTFNGDIYNIDFEGDKLLITILYGGDICVLGVTFHLNVDEDLNDNSVLLDERISSDDLTVTYTGEDSVVTLPVTPTSNTILVVAPSDTSGVLPVGRELQPIKDTTTSLTFKGVDLRNVKFFIGNTINTDWVLNPLYVRDDRQVPIQDGRTQLRTVSFQFSNTANFKVYTTAPSRPTNISSFTGINIGSSKDPLNAMTLDTGEFRVPVYGEADKVTIRVSSTSPWRVRFTSVEWGGTYRPKRRRV